MDGGMDGWRAINQSINKWMNESKIVYNKAGSEKVWGRDEIFLREPHSVVMHAKVLPVIWFQTLTILYPKLVLCWHRETSWNERKTQDSILICSGTGGGGGGPLCSRFFFGEKWSWYGHQSLELLSSLSHKRLILLLLRLMQDHRPTDWLKTDRPTDPPAHRRTDRHGLWLISGGCWNTWMVACRGGGRGGWRRWCWWWWWWWWRWWWWWWWWWWWRSCIIHPTHRLHHPSSIVYHPSSHCTDRHRMKSAVSTSTQLPGIKL